MNRTEQPTERFRSCSAKIPNWFQIRKFWLNKSKFNISAKFSQRWGSLLYNFIYLLLFCVLVFLPKYVWLFGRFHSKVRACSSLGSSYVGSGSLCLVASLFNFFIWVLQPLQKIQLVLQLKWAPPSFLSFIIKGIGIHLFTHALTHYMSLTSRVTAKDWSLVFIVEKEVP